MAATTTLPTAGASWRDRRARAAVWAASRAATAVRLARTWHLGRSVPGFAGIGLVSAGLALRFGVWAGLICAGLALLRIDSRV